MPRRSTKLPVPVAALLVSLGVHAYSGPVRADAADDAATAKELSKPAERRSGVVVGFGVGLGAAGASGYPNAQSKIGDPAYYDGSDALGGWGGSVFFMGALSDWLNFGVFYARANFRSRDWYSYGGGGGFKVDLFPFYRLAPKLKDLAVFGQFGIGTATLAPTSGTREAATGTESLLGGGAFYEFFLGKGWGGHFAAGPLVEYDAVVTQAIERQGVLLGGRVAFYGGR